MDDKFQCFFNVSLLYQKDLILLVKIEFAQINIDTSTKKVEHLNILYYQKPNAQNHTLEK